MICKYCQGPNTYFFVDMVAVTLMQYVSVYNIRTSLGLYLVGICSLIQSSIQATPLYSSLLGRAYLLDRRRSRYEAKKKILVDAFGDISKTHDKACISAGLQVTGDSIYCLSLAITQLSSQRRRFDTSGGSFQQRPHVYPI